MVFEPLDCQFGQSETDLWQFKTPKSRVYQCLSLFFHEKFKKKNKRRKIKELFSNCKIGCLLSASLKSLSMSLSRQSLYALSIIISSLLVSTHFMTSTLPSSPSFFLFLVVLTCQPVRFILDLHSHIPTLP